MAANMTAVKLNIIKECLSTPEGQKKLVASMAAPLWLHMDYHSTGLRLLLVHPETEPPGHHETWEMDTIASGSLSEHRAGLVEHVQDALRRAILGGLDPWVIGLLGRNAVGVKDDTASTKELLAAAVDLVDSPGGRILIHPFDLASFEAVFPRDPACPTCGQHVSSDWSWETLPELLNLGLCATYGGFHVLLTEHTTPGSVFVTNEAEALGSLWDERQIEYVDGTVDSITARCRMAVKVHLNPDGKVVRFELPGDYRKDPDDD